MRKNIALVPMLVLFLFSVSAAHSENSSDSIVLYRLQEGEIKDIHNDFSIGSENLRSILHSIPRKKETGVEFRWINPSSKKEQAFFEQVKSPLPTEEKNRDPAGYSCTQRLSDKIIGSRFFGRWRLEIWVNNRRVAGRDF